MKVTCLVFMLFFAFNSFGQDVQKESPSDEFWNQLTEKCGKTYRGYITKGAKVGDGFTGEILIMHIKKCSDNQILIPFNVGDNRSRTWILTKQEDGRIELKHDHRHKDGSDDEITMYGGTSSNVGLKNVQVFPADVYTQTTLPHAASNVWWITLDDKFFSYNLKRLGTKMEFTAVFDLQNELPTPKPSWGWE